MPLVVLPSHKLTSPDYREEELVTGSFFYIMSRGGICEEGNDFQDPLASFGNWASESYQGKRAIIAKTGKKILKICPVVTICIASW